ncbi:MAG: acetyl-CoA acetyltransferase [Deltaproteobacteria bacterium]|nr:acetyl-CoA acetyltransferase [Deltaproteobacteria bacterium]
MAEHAAVIGIGQTDFDAKRVDVSQVGLIREAALRALKDAQLEWSDIDAVVIGKAPDMFEGVMMPELFLAEALGCVGKPMLRVHTAGSVGGSTAIVAASLVQSGIHKRVLTVSYEKQSESNAMWALSIKLPFSQTLVAGAGGFFAPLIRGYMARSGAPEDTGIRVALKDRLNALKNPVAHLKLPDVTFEMIANSPMLWDPIRYLETCPSSDGACALIIGDSAAAKQSRSHPPAWIHATQMKTEPTMFAKRDQVMPQAGLDCSAALYKKAGITDPRKEIDCAEVYVPFSWFEPMWMENLHFAPPGEGWRMTYEGATALDGDLPINMSGGVLCTNAIGASGMVRFAEAAMQVRGQAGEHQIDGAKKALGHAYGGGSQYFSMWIVGDQPL